jgi:hypothetical protein
MQCKVLYIKTERAFDRYEEQSVVVSRMENEINRWLNAGWKLINAIYDGNYRSFVVFLTHD